MGQRNEPFFQPKMAGVSLLRKPKIFIDDRGALRPAEGDDPYRMPVLPLVLITVLLGIISTCGAIAAIYVFG